MTRLTKTRRGTLSQAECKWVKSLQSAKFRRQLGLFIIEGEKLIEEMLPHYRCRMLIGTDELVAPFVEHPAHHIEEVIIVPDAEQINRISGLKTPRPIIAILTLISSPSVSRIDGPTLLLDDVQDPGNMGTILRTCDWFGIRTVLCTSGCADAYSPKVLQASMGALARVRVHRYEERAELRKLLRECKVPIVGTFFDSIPLRTLRLPSASPYVVILGNEGKGIAPDLESLVSERVTILSPVSEHCESLNVAVAGAIVLAYLSRSL